MIFSGGFLRSPLYYKTKRMNKKLFSAVIIATAIFCACNKKDNIVDLGPPAAPATHYYTSIKDFYQQNGVPVQVFTVNAAAGGTFTAAKGTKVTIPANAFVAQGGGSVSGNVTIEFREVYTKSEMLLSNMATNTIWGTPLKSAGEFFIKASANNSAVVMAPGKMITVEQPANGAFDPAMAAFEANADTAGNMLWGGAQNGVLDTANQGGGGGGASSYVYNMYQFNMPADSGTWCNSDNAGYFAAYPQTVFTINTVNIPAGVTHPDVFLIFSGVNSMVHVYEDWNNPGTYPYNYAPQGLSATIVVLGIKDGELYASFTPTTIGANQTVNASVAPITTENFKTTLQGLN